MYTCFNTCENIRNPIYIYRHTYIHVYILYIAILPITNIYIYIYTAVYSISGDIII